MAGCPGALSGRTEKREGVIPYAENNKKNWNKKRDGDGDFISSVSLFSKVKKGDRIGVIVKPILGAVIEEITAPMDGVIFTLRRYPSVREGALIARIAGESYD